MTRCFTLIELLAVLAIISLIAATASVGLVSGTQHARLNAAVSSLKNMDAHARLFGQRGQSVVISIDREKNVVLLYSRQELLSECDLPKEFITRISVDDRDSETISFDSLGRSSDYEVTLSIGAELKSCKICGLTGWVVENEALP